MERVPSSSGGSCWADTSAVLVERLALQSAASFRVTPGPAIANLRQRTSSCAGTSANRRSLCREADHVSCAPTDLAARLKHVLGALDAVHAPRASMKSPAADLNGANSMVGTTTV